MPPESNPPEKLIMIFGVFDGLHDGHISFLNQARELGDRLMVVVAQDESVMRLKKHLPRLPLAERIKALEESDLAHTIIPGDETEGGWEVVRKHQPHIVALGYDQAAMYEDLAKCLSSFPFPCDIVVLDPYKPEEMHSSLLKESRRS